MKKHRWPAALLGSAAAAFACSCVAGDSAAADRDAGADTVTFEDVHRAIVQEKCTPSCHVEEADPPAGRHALILADPDVAYGALIDAPSENCPDLVRVSPGAPEESLLWLKLAPGVPVCGFKMPPECFTDDCGLPAEEADLIYDWIAAGAPR